MDEITGNDLENILLDENINLDDITELVEEQQFDVAEDFQKYVKGYLEKRGKKYPEGGIPSASPLFSHIYQAYQIEVLSKKKRWDKAEPLPEPEYKAPPKRDIRSLLDDQQRRLDELKKQGII